MVDANDYIQTPDGEWVRKDRLNRKNDRHIKIESRVIFDASDVNYLLTHLIPAQLRNEIHHADVEQSVAKTFGEDSNELYWEDFGKACELALDIQKSMQSKSGYKGNSAIKQIKETTDIGEVVGRYTELKGKGAQYYGCCPFHDDHVASLSIDSDKQLWHCFACNKGGDVIDFIKLAENVDTKGAISILRGANGKGAIEVLSRRS